MPRLDGVSATMYIRQHCPATPIIAMTSNIRPDEVNGYFEHGKLASPPLVLFFFSIWTLLFLRTWPFWKAMGPRRGEGKKLLIATSQA